MSKLLFLGYDRSQTKLIDLIESKGWSVDQTGEPISDLSAYDLAVSFGYRHILNADALQTTRRPVLNLHIAYLPWNRGAHPLFWAAYDGTPAGVTIHEIDSVWIRGPYAFRRKSTLTATLKRLPLAIPS